ncbi:MAG: hypothetical protein QOH63_472 [Acidobacteriota bacterium]|nr:hypothetical protein [Acidobacteriota bacterium]
MDEIVKELRAAADELESMDAEVGGSGTDDSDGRAKLISADMTTEPICELAELARRVFDDECE